MALWPVLLYPHIFSYLMFYPTELESTVIIKTRELIAIINPVGFNHYIFTNYVEVNSAFSRKNVDSLKE